MGLIAHKGIIYGSGSDVVPNPQDAATDELEKLGIDGDVYEVTDADYRSNMHTFTETGYDTSTHKFDGLEISTTYAVKSIFSPLARVYNALKTAINDHASVFTTINTAISDLTTALSNKVNKDSVTFTNLTSSGHRFGTDLSIVGQFTGSNDVNNENTNLTAIKSVVNNLADYTEDNVQVESLDDTTPYLYRQSPAIGTRVMENALVGASVVRNQLIQATRKTASHTFDASASYLYNMVAMGNDNVYFRSGRKYLISAKITRTIATNNGLSFVLRMSAGGDATINIQNGAADGYYSTIHSPSADGKINYVSVSNYNYKNGYAAGDTIAYDDFFVVDLTQWFGSSTIPDAVYTKEQATAGSGIAWLKSQGFDFSEYIEYNTGTIESVNPTGKKVYDEHDTLVAEYSIAPYALHGIPQLVDGDIIYDGDIRKASGSVTKNYEYRAYQSGDESLPNAITDGTNTVVKRTTPSQGAAAPFDNPQISIVDGTEEWITDNDVPVGHDSEYKSLPALFDDDYIQYLQEQAENVIGEIEAVTPISGTATVTLLHEEDQGEDWIVGFTGEINGHFDTDHFDYFLTARYTHAYNTNTQILNMNSCSDGDYVNIWQTGTLDFSVDGGVTVDISVTATTLTFTVNCIGDSVFGIYSSSETTGEVKYLITPARKG